MKSFEMGLVKNGGYSLHQCFGELMRTQLFLKEVKKKCGLDHKSMKQRCVTMNSLSNPCKKGRLVIYSEPKHGGRCEIGKFQRDKRVDDKADNDISKMLDRWVRNSIREIVNKIEEAPFLLHIFSNDGSEGSKSTTTIRLEREKADAKNWPLIKGRWDLGSLTPNGIILVEELTGKKSDIHSDEEGYGNKLDATTTRLWGLLIQVSGESWTACYILKTCTVHTLSGFCTHFCLTKIKCFNETAEVQLRKSWLQM